MACAARVNNQAGLFELSHHCAGPTGVIEVYVGWNYIFHLGAIDTQLLQGCQHVGQRMKSASLDDRNFVTLAQQIYRCNPRLDVQRINAVDILCEGRKLGHGYFALQCSAINNQVSITESGFSEMLLMPCSSNHSARSG